MIAILLDIYLNIVIYLPWSCSLQIGPLIIIDNSASTHYIDIVFIKGQKFGYDEINLNVGCPSPKVRKGRFGACLMFEPSLVKDCLQAMIKATKIPISVKSRT